MISRELISRVLNLNITLVDTKYSETTKRIRYVTSDNNDYYIDVYNLAHKCKEWALKNDCQLLSCIKESNSLCDIYSNTYNCKFTHYADTEAEAIFKACQWVLKQQSGCSE